MSGVADGGDGSDDEVVIGDDVEEVAEPVESAGGSSGSSLDLAGGISENRFASEDPARSESASSSADAAGAFGFEAQQTEDLFDDQQLPDWVGWHQPSDIQVDGLAGDAPHSSDDPSPDSDGGLPSACAPEFGQVFGKVEAATPAFEAEMKPAAGDETEAPPSSSDCGLVSSVKRKTSRTAEPEAPGGDGARLLELGEINYWRVEQEAGVVKE